MEMRNHGLNPDILEDEDAELPDDGQGGSGGAVGGARDDSEVGSSAASSSSEESDDSFESDWVLCRDIWVVYTSVLVFWRLRAVLILSYV